MHEKWEGLQQGERVADTAITYTIILKLTRPQGKHLEREARDLGFPSASAYIRDLLFREEKGPKRPGTLAIIQEEYWEFKSSTAHHVFDMAGLLSVASAMVSRISAGSVTAGNGSIVFEVFRIVTDLMDNHVQAMKKKLLGINNSEVREQGHECIEDHAD
jgi:hypothetical protein